MTKDEALKEALDALKHVEDVYCVTYEEAMIAIESALAQQEPLEPEPFGYFQYDIRLDAWVQNRINNKGVAFYKKEKNQ